MLPCCVYPLQACEDLTYLLAMTLPGAGRNDLPPRLKSLLFVVGVPSPDVNTLGSIFGQMLSHRFGPLQLPELSALAQLLPQAAIRVWNTVKTKLLPTPSKFHYAFSMRDLSRVFQSVLLTEVEVFVSPDGIGSPNPAMRLLQLWKHECARVFQDRLVSMQDKDWYESIMQSTILSMFGPDAEGVASEEFHCANFFRDDVYDADGVRV